MAALTRTARSTSPRLRSGGRLSLMISSEISAWSRCNCPRACVNNPVRACGTDSRTRAHSSIRGRRVADTARSTSWTSGAMRWPSGVSVSLQVRAAPAPHRARAPVQTAPTDGRVLGTHPTGGAGQRFRLRRTQEESQVVPVEIVNGSHARLYGSQNSQPEHFLCKPGVIPDPLVMTAEPRSSCSRRRGYRKARFPHHSSTGGSRS